ncbi:hypothetical protein GA0115259_1034128 [Streptomyces sp. MnatMP-M17]|nr:hypothetical protein GA0115259_1034128 [Streptomyces sp. MnatMP-M17]
MDPVLIAAGVIVLVSAVRGAAQVARRWAVSQVARVVAEVLDQQGRPGGRRQPLLPRPVPRAEWLTGTEGFRDGGRSDR